MYHLFETLKAILKRCVLSLLSNNSKVSESFLCWGSWFHSFGQANAKDRSPEVVVLDLGTDRLLAANERRERAGL